MVTQLRRRTVLAGLVSTCVVPAAHACGLPEPVGPVILTVSGTIAKANHDGTARFDLAMLRSLPRRSFTTSTIWTEGKATYTGVSLDVLLDHLGASGSWLRATAINDYETEIPITDATPDGPIIAYEIDGQPMSRRDKGPLWIVYPYDSSLKYHSVMIHIRSIWQLERIAVVD